MQIADTHEAVCAYDAELFKEPLSAALPKATVSFDDNDPAHPVMDSGPPVDR